MSTLVRLWQKSGLTQAQIAARTQVSKSLLSGVFGGKRQLSLRSLYVILVALDAKPSEAWLVLSEFAAQTTKDGQPGPLNVDVRGAA